MFLWAGDLKVSHSKWQKLADPDPDRSAGALMASLQPIYINGKSGLSYASCETDLCDVLSGIQEEQGKQSTGLHRSSTHKLTSCSISLKAIHMGGTTVKIRCSSALI